MNRTRLQIPFEVKPHAVDRFMQRSGASDRERAAATLRKFAALAMPWSRAKNQWHHNGWILVIRRRAILTVYRL
ncbi:MAG: hypothetical protein J0L84_00345 [Verrucomicrobia bacterium]|nr:hypothetical protein [Verrucomicrobiota bacterium]